MARAADISNFGEFRTQAREDFQLGMSLFNTYRNLLILLALVAAITAISQNTFEDFVLGNAAYLGITDYHQAVLWHWHVVFILIAIGAAAYYFNWGLLVFITRWQRRHAWRLFNETSLLWSYAMADQTGAQDQPPPTRCQRLLIAFRLRPPTPSPEPGTLVESLTKLVQRFDHACRRVRYRGAPVVLYAVQWLSVSLAFLYVSVVVWNYTAAHPNILNPVFLSPCNSPSYPELTGFIWRFWLAIGLVICIERLFQMGRRIGTRQALMNFLGMEDTQPRRDRQA